MTSTNEAVSGRAVKRIRAKALLFLLLSSVAGLGAVYLVKWYLDEVRTGAGSGTIRTTEVVVAAQNLPVGTTLTAQHLTVVGWPVSTVPQGVFAAPGEVVGRTLQQSVVKGDTILPDKLADKSAGRGLAALLKPGARAMAVKVDQVVGVAGFVQPGDRVDVIATMAPDDETRAALGHDAARVSKIILQNVGVLAIGEHMTSQGSKPVAVQVVTLEVSPGESERLALASRHGDIQLIMRSRVDAGPVPTAGITPMALLSPDEGAIPMARRTPEPTVAAAAPAPETPPTARRYPAARRSAAPQPSAPVVEILRGNKVEERRLRASFDSGKVEAGGKPSGVLMDSR
jgi:pilus assembly protein CpaB